jgi:hypothetical protein
MMRTVYCGVDFHARMQTIAYCDSADGEIQLRLKNARLTPAIKHQSDDS